MNALPPPAYCSDNEYLTRFPMFLVIITAAFFILRLASKWPRIRLSLCEEPPPSHVWNNGLGWRQVITESPLSARLHRFLRRFPFSVEWLLRLWLLLPFGGVAAATLISGLDKPLHISFRTPEILCSFLSLSVYCTGVIIVMAVVHEFSHVLFYPSRAEHWAVVSYSRLHHVPYAQFSGELTRRQFFVTTLAPFVVTALVVPLGILAFRMPVAIAITLAIFCAVFCIGDFLLCLSVFRMTPKGDYFCSHGVNLYQRAAPSPPPSR